MLSNSPHDESAASESSSVFSYESSDEEGHFSYSQSSPEYEEESFDLASGFKKLKIRDNKDDLPVQYHKSGPIGPVFPLDVTSSLKKINPKYFGDFQLVPHDKTVYLSFSTYGSEVLSYVSSRISVANKKHIQRLALDFAGRDLPRKEFRSMIAFFTKSFPSAKYLFLNFRESARNLTNRDLIWLGLHVTKYMPNLKHFVLRLNENDSITSKTFNLFCRQIAKRSKNLALLFLDFDKCRGIRGYCFKSLTHYMSKCLRNLKSLSLNIPIVTIDDMENLYFNKTNFLIQTESLDLAINLALPSSSEKLQKNLRQFSLHLHAGFDILMRLYLFSPCLEFAENLRFLNIDFRSFVIAQGEKTLVQTINSKIKTLDGLKINLFVHDKVIHQFLKFLKSPESSQLKKLELGFDSNAERYPSKALPMKLFSPFISNFLQPLKNLTYLDLRLQTLDIKDAQVKDLTACISKDLVKLEFIYIYFFMCPKMTDESVRAFQEDFCAEDTLVSLKTLHLKISNCRRVNKGAIKILRSALKKRVPAIESVIVDFLDYPEDPHYCSSDDSDKEDARVFVESWGSEYKAIKIHPDADPEYDSNWRFVKREDYENDKSSYYESDGDPEAFSREWLESKGWRRVREDSDEENDEESEENEESEDEEDEEEEEEENDEEDGEDGEDGEDEEDEEDGENDEEDEDDDS